jgi:hypothetical protein
MPRKPRKVSRSTSKSLPPSVKLQKIKFHSLAHQGMFSHRYEQAQKLLKRINNAQVVSEVKQLLLKLGYASQSDLLAVDGELAAFFEKHK